MVYYIIYIYILCLSRPLSLSLPPSVYPTLCLCLSCPLSCLLSVSPLSLSVLTSVSVFPVFCLPYLLSLPFCLWLFCPSFLSLLTSLSVSTLTTVSLSFPFLSEFLQRIPQEFPHLTTVHGTIEHGKCKKYATVEDSADCYWRHYDVQWLRPLAAARLAWDWIPPRPDCAKKVESTWSHILEV